MPLCKRVLSSAGSEHLPYKQRVGGSNPSTPTKSDLSCGKSLFDTFADFSIFAYLSIFLHHEKKFAVMVVPFTPCRGSRLLFF